MNENLTYIAVVLDRSGSMQNVQQATIEGFKTFLNEQKKVPGEGLFTLIQFDTQYEVHDWEKPLKKATFETFQPRGGTALLDALGKTITDVGLALAVRPESARPGKVLFVIITDGEENSSREFTREKVFEMITHQREKYSWEFLFLGANQDAIATATSMGMSPQSALSYVSNPVGAYNAFSTASASSSGFRGGVTKNAIVSEKQKLDYDANTAAGVTLPDNVAGTPSTPGGGSTP